MFLQKRLKHVHMVGIGGIGMSGIAEVLLNQGFRVSGSDRQLSDITAHLQEHGANIYSGHAAENVSDADVLVYSSAVNEDNPEVRAARERNIPVIRRAEMLSELMRMKYGVAIAGTHGKTSTSSMTGLVVTHGGLDPTLIIGGKVRSLRSNARLGDGELLIAEADEYDRSFLSLAPAIAIITNIEADHMDCYADMDDLRTAFTEFANKVPFYGTVICCLDSENVMEILPQINKSVTTYGFSAQADYRAVKLTFTDYKSRFVVMHQGREEQAIELSVPGRHNIANALAAYVVGRELGLDAAVIAEGLRRFTGVMRRFEIKYQSREVTVVDDYAHHPTEVKATLAAARNSARGRIIAVFQPHLYSRTQALSGEFGKAFTDADVFIVCPIYPAREQPLPGVSAALVAEAAAQFGHKNVHLCPTLEAVPKLLHELQEKGDIIIGLGAGDVWRAINAYIAELNK
jgi:UDP-N-acetylmuramate--alanine ligase